MKITEIPPAEPTYHIELSQEELNVLYMAIQPDSVEEGYEDTAYALEETLLTHVHHKS